MIKLKSTDQQPPGTRLAVIKGDDMFCYFCDDEEVIAADMARAEDQSRARRYRQKETRKLHVENINIRTSAGNAFNGDETSQQRMARAILVMSDTDTLPWTLADNTVAAIRKVELIEALKLSVMQQTALWHIRAEQKQD